MTGKLRDEFFLPGSLEAPLAQPARPSWSGLSRPSADEAKQLTVQQNFFRSRTSGQARDDGGEGVDCPLPLWERKENQHLSQRLSARFSK